MAKIYIDNVPYEVKDGQNVLHAGLSLKLDIPYFCWHPALGSVGACRQCAVKQFRDENDTQGRIVMACMTPASEGTRVSISDPDAKDFRQRVIEWLMENHPHDCPVCDEGGECHLQDMTVMTGHTYRRYRFKKRTYRNQYLGPLINHEMNRCIQCYRCVRFYQDFAKGDDLDVFGVHDQIYFGRHEDGVLQSEFSGNLVEVCPTGVFTDKTLKQHYTRKWDLTTAPSVCVHCSLGCNTIPGERYGLLRRIRNRYNDQVNGYFLCDRGRYGYEFVNSPRRIRWPRLDTGPESSSDGASPRTPEAVAQHLKPLLADNRRVIGIGSPRASLEANFALRALVGPDCFYNGMSQQEHNLVATALKILQEGPARSCPMKEVEEADAVLVLGEDLNNSAPMLALAVYQALRQKPLAIAQQLQIPLWHDAAVREAIETEVKSPVFIATPAETRLDGLAAETYRGAPEDLARLGQTIAQMLGADIPAVRKLPGEVKTLAEKIAQGLRDAKRPAIISGPGAGSEAVMQAAANIAWVLGAELCLTMPECNSFGLGLMGGQSLEAAFEAVQEGSADTIIILENDLFRRAGAASVENFLNSASHVIVLDHLDTPTAAKAGVALPAATFAESDGTLVNNEGRAQRFYQVFVPQDAIRESWRWLRDMLVISGRGGDAAWDNLDDISAALAETLPVFRPIREIAPPADFRIVGQKIARQPHRFSGRTAMFSNITLHEPTPPPDPDAPLVFSMEGYYGELPPALFPRFWAPGWNSIQALNKFQDEVAGPLKGGSPGRRLVEPPSNGQQAAYFQETPGAFSPRRGEWLVVPLYHIFGSDELSVLTPGIAELAPPPYLALNPADASGLQLAEGETVELNLAGALYRLQLRLNPSLPAGVAGVAVGLPGSPAVTLPAWSSITKEAGV